MQPGSTRPVMDIRPQRPAPQPVQRPNFSQPVPAPAPAAPAPVPDQPAEVHPTPVHFPAELPKPRTPKVAIGVAVLVGISLIGLTVFGYMKSQDEAETAKTTPETTQAISAEDVSESVTETDAALEALDDTADFNSADLSDDSLGL